jgi:hypothetical protein
LILGIDQIGTRIKEQYDKVIAFVVLLLLLSSLLYLGVKVGLIRQMQADFDGWLKSRRPVNPEAEVIASDVFDAGRLSLEAPFQLDHAAWTNGAMFVPETRFNCRECLLPVHIAAERCPFCKTEAEEPAPPNPDADGDGMPTVWEQRYGLDPFDASDADKDNDNDGYTNLAECKEGTSPTDDTDKPAAVERLVLERITGQRFGLRFNSRVKTKSGYKFGLNYQLPDGTTKTDFAEIGDTVAGFILKGYEEKMVKVEKPFPHTADLSELTLATEDGQIIVLVKGKARLHVELTAHLTLMMPDGSVTRQAVKKDETFELDGAMHRVIAIDVAEARVVIRDERKQREIVVQRASAAASEAVLE